MNIIYTGDNPAQVSLSIEMYINWPRERFATVPISLSVSIDYIAGPVMIPSISNF
jgi:hypothetical protein